MSWKQRRDHHPVPGAGRDGDVVCMECGMPLVEVARHYTDRHRNDLIIDTHWRHPRRKP